MEKEVLSEKRKENLRQDCLNEAFWSRSLPLGVASGLVALLAVKTGKIKVSTGPTSTWSVVVGFGCMGYVLAKLNYILGDQCRDVFLRVNEVTLNQYSCSEMEGREREMTIKLDRILAAIDEDDMSDTELHILSDCNTVANYKYGFPLAGLFGGTTYLALRAKVLNESTLVTLFPKVPKTLFGVMLGFTFGSYVYHKSADCPKRFQKYDYNGKIAQYLRENSEVLDSQIQQDYTEYTFPDEDTAEELRLSIHNSWHNSFSQLLKPK